MTGATKSEWVHWDVFLDLTSDLLPFVATPNLPLSPHSQLSAYGKVPSLINGSGQVVGLSQWPTRVTTDADIAGWSRNPNYGICLNTRRVRAIDVDIDDAAYSARVLRAILAWNPSIVWPVRMRPNSSKHALLFELEGSFGKQRLATPHGIIEFLATGQQILIAGPHSSGARYRWAHSDSLGIECLPLHIPVLTEEEWADLRDTLEMVFGSEEWSAGRVGKARDRESISSVENDPVAVYLKANGWAV